MLLYGRDLLGAGAANRSDCAGADHKEVYISLLIGILTGALFFTGFNPVTAVETAFGIMGSKIGDNANIILFLIFLGMLVALMTKSGASRAYGNWASKPFAPRGEPWAPPPH